jgi:endonuclease/exonuclease/phosphatase family metal-dependent hydrolase
MPMSNFSIATFNIRYDADPPCTTHGKAEKYPWRERLPRITEFLAQKKWDIIGMQECLPSQLADLQRTLGANYDVYGEASLTPARERDAEQVCMAPLSPIWWRRDRFTLLDKGMLWLNAKRQRGASNCDLLHFVPRLCTWVELTEQSSVRRLRVYCTQFDNVPFYPLLIHFIRRYHNLSAEIILRHIGESSAPALCLGDLNFRPAAPTYALLAGQLRDSYPDPAAATRPPTCHQFLPDDRGVHIDYIWHSAGLRRLSYEIVNPYRERGTKKTEDFLSDHHPVVAGFELPPP